MSLLQGQPLPNITTTKEIDTQGPDWYNQYLESLAAPGNALLGMTGEQLVSPMSSLQTGALGLAPDALTRYQDVMQSAQDTAGKAAQGITPELIQQYMNPYTSNVVDEMGRLQQQNLQRNVLPSLRGAFAGTGSMGSTRMGGALGQAMADMQANLTGQQGLALQAGYKQAMDTAGQQAGLYRSAADTQRGLATSDLDSASKMLEEMYGLGSKEQQFEQSKILAPVAAAKSAADVYSNLKVPTTVSETANAPIPGAYSTSPLAQIAGLGSLFASGTGGTSAASGFMNTVSNLMKGLTTATPSNLSYAGQNPEGSNLWYDSSTGAYQDSSGNAVPIDWTL